MNLKSLIPWRRDERQVARRAEGNPFLELQQRMNSLFDDFFGRSSSQLWDGFGADFAPRVDVNETSKEVLVTAELPGLEEKDVEVTLAGNLLTIKGEKNEEQQEEKGDYWHSERSYGFFQRAIELPPAINGDQAKAKLKNGILKLVIPKKPEAQSRRRKIELVEG